MRTILLVLDLVSIFYNLIFTIIEWLNEQICLSNAQTSLTSLKIYKMNR